MKKWPLELITSWALAAATSVCDNCLFDVLPQHLNKIQDFAPKPLFHFFGAIQMWICLGSLSCYIIQLHPSLSSWADGQTLSFRIFWFLQCASGHLTTTCCISLLHSIMCYFLRPFILLHIARQAVFKWCLDWMGLELVMGGYEEQNWTQLLIEFSMNESFKNCILC